MNLAMVKEVLYDIASMFFQGAPVIWAEQMNTKPTPPYITLKVGNMNRTHFPLIGEGGNRYYPCSTTVEIFVHQGKACYSTGERDRKLYEYRSIRFE